MCWYADYAEPIPEPSVTLVVTADAPTSSWLNLQGGATLYSYSTLTTDYPPAAVKFNKIVLACELHTKEQKLWWSKVIAQNAKPGYELFITL